ncbi:hypothetical protein H4R33_003240 [Dimargaris cristalligena]|uniref:Transmembrane protein 242 n=1 Tax=Dimargaris cristalligena TaxID=215637 RepID=A0A4V1J5G7_9FUNG|nr:hypothetical protein H4R33_003240 [Dimargaris cristalligena]RKP38999.1 hypothetical protein BJ085DRAFT_37946 [Dimargaris cristalligena]|eukprot:RKP38999.1 hypothetical protein BJ085DRAFT_37946 [Dimargaris cristalligena]
MPASKTETGKGSGGSDQEPEMSTVQMMALAGGAFAVGLFGSLWLTRKKSTGFTQHPKVLARMSQSAVHKDARKMALKSLGYATAMTFSAAGLVVFGAGALTGTSNIREFSLWLTNFSRDNLRGLKSKATQEMEQTPTKDIDQEWSNLMSNFQDSPPPAEEVPSITGSSEPKP